MMFKGKVLIVDDEPGILQFMEQALKQDGYLVKVTNDPFVALEILAEEKDTELLITDLRMPKMDGFELMVKARQIIPDIAIIVMTAQATLETAVECLRQGASDYLVKPFELSEMFISIEKALENRKIRNQLVSLEEVGRLKDDFISTLSHELRTPLMGILGALELISQEFKRNPSLKTQDNEIIRKSLAIIERQSIKMKKLVEVLLDYAKMEAGYFQLEMTEVVLDRVIEEAIGDIKNLADEKNIAITSLMDASDTTIVRGSASALKQVLVNILSNAIKYTANGGKITVGISRQDNFSEVFVQDTGIGLEKNQLEKIFEKFYRVDQSLTRTDYGVGLGLSIAKRIVEMHGGKIWAESSGPGQGTTIRFTIPLAVQKVAR